MKRSPLTVIETKRLILREMTLGDLEELLEVFSDPGVIRYCPQVFDRPLVHWYKSGSSAMLKDTLDMGLGYGC